MHGEEALVSVEAIPATDEGLTSEETTLMARIPLLAGSDRKYAYLAYRSTGFTIRQSAQLVGVNLSTVKRWREKDDTFRKIESNELQRLQETIGNDVIRFEFLRNMRMLLKSDMKVIAHGINNINDLSPREFELFKNLRRFYTPSDMLALEKILHPEKHKDGPVTIQLTWGPRLISNDNSMQENDSIEGEYKVVDDGDISPL